jgi:hypothetical protein
MRLHAIFSYTWNATLGKLVYEHVEDVPFDSEAENNGIPAYTGDSGVTHGFCVIDVDDEADVAQFVSPVGPENTLVIMGGSKIPRLELVHRVETWLAESV